MKEESSEEYRFHVEEFVSMQKEITNGDASTALDVLRRIVAIEESSIEPSTATIDAVSDAIQRSLAKIEITELLGRHQDVVLLLLSSRAPEFVIRRVVLRLHENAALTRPLLAGPAYATAVALARNIAVEDVTEEIAQLIGPLFAHQEVLNEIVRQCEMSRNDRDPPASADATRFALYVMLKEAIAAGVWVVEMEPVFAKLRADLTSGDYLLQMATFDMVSDIAIKAPADSAAKLIDSFGPTLYGLLKHSQEGPDGGFLYSGALKCIAELCSLHPSSFDTFPDVLPSLAAHVEMFASLDATNRARAFELFSLVARTTEGKKQVINRLGRDRVASCMAKYALAIASSPAELRNRHLDAVAFLLKQGDEADIQFLFSSIGADFPTQLAVLVERPFPETRAAVYEVWMALLAHKSGAHLLIATPKFVEWLLPYKGTSWADAQAWRDVTKALLASGEMDVVMEQRIRDAVTEQSNPKPPAPQVATEEA